MSFSSLPMLFSTLLLLSLTSPPASGKPIPPEIVNSPSTVAARSSNGDGGLKTWEIAVLVVGSILGIMLVGGLGGACEVLLHAKGRIVQSNAEADAKVEAGGNRALELEDGYGGEGGSGSDAPTEVGVMDDSHFSWQAEKMTTGEEDMSVDRALSEAETIESSQITLNGEQSSIDVENPATHAHGLGMGEDIAAAQSTDTNKGKTRDRILPWEDDVQQDPALSQFVIGDEEDLDYYGQEAVSHDRQQDHFAQPVALLPGSDFQHESTDNHHEHQEDTCEHESNAFQSGEPIDQPHEHIGEALSAVPVGAYSGEGNSPALMPDEADYLAEYRQSQLYLQQEDDWQQYYSSTQGTYGTGGEQDGHNSHEGVVPQPDPGYF